MLTAHGYEIATLAAGHAEVNPAAWAVEAKLRQHSFLDIIRNCHSIYVIANGGVVSRRVCTEIGFAYALDKGVVASEPPREAAVVALVDVVLPLVELATTPGG